jgi:nitroreductase
MMEALEAIQKRRSVRKFTGEPISREALEKIVDAGRLAATGSNQQPWDFIVVTNQDTMDQLTLVGRWMRKAAAIIVVVLDPYSRWWLEDGSAAIQNMLIASTALGYGSCWVEGDALPREEEFKTLLYIPKGKRLLALIPIGVPEDWPEVEKRPLESVLHWQVY